MNYRTAASSQRKLSETPSAESGPESAPNTTDGSEGWARRHFDDGAPATAGSVASEPRRRRLGRTGSWRVTINQDLETRFASATLGAMALRSGSANLPLHGGHVPAWLAGRMARLGRVIVEAIAHHYGTEEVLRRLSHPFWFQAFGSVMGMDWHSSGITTSVLGALKRGLAPVQDELGLYVCGGRGKHSRKTPAELLAIGELTGLDGEALGRASRLVAKVDSAAVQDGFGLYLHGFFVTRGGAWTVVQQGMDPARREARRYHWLSEGLRDFVDEPHSAIDGKEQGEIVNLTDRRAAESRRAQLELVARGPAATLDVLAGQLARAAKPQPKPVPAPAQLVLPHLALPHHHEVTANDVVLRRLHGTLRAAHESGPRDFSELLLVPGVGARTVEALAMVSEVIHGAPYRFSDPARFSLAHGGKDRHPFPVPLKVYDQTLSVLRTALDRARLGESDRLSAIERLDRQARAFDRALSGPSFDEHVNAERARSHALGGMSVFGPEPPAEKP